MSYLKILFILGGGSFYVRTLPRTQIALYHIIDHKTSDHDFFLYLLLYTYITFTIGMVENNDF